MTDCVLSYALTTVPAPLTVSPPAVEPGQEDENSYASIDLVISNSGSTPVRCSRIALVLPVGSLAQDLALTGEGIAPYVEPESGWTIVSPQPDVLVAVPTAETAVFPSARENRGDASGAKVRFEVVPRDGTSEVTVDGLYITLSNILVSDKTGIARIGIEEWATTGDTIPETPNTSTLDVAKYPFRSGANPSPGVGRALVALKEQGGPPATLINAGAPVRLEWHHAPGDSHELYMNGLRIDDPSIAGGSMYQVGRDTVLRDTALALKTVTPTPVGGFVTRWDHLTVCVADQTLASLTTTGDATVEGAFGVTGQTTVSALAATGNTTVGGTLGVTGQTTVSALAATENATVAGTLGVTGQTTVNTLAATGNTTVGGTLGVTGQTTVAGLNVTGALSGVSVKVTPDEHWDKEWKESQAGDREAPAGKVMVGRHHRGDENGWTGHRYARITID
ncbi:MULTISPECIES: hypothetical protein [Streptomyces]|uniref:hypothetical protein n=1 Tax=Streptomyces TaxID=1883 RepID=UPI00196475C1|nr:MULTISPECIES: hypothetical protein [Streptomyces]QRX90349.1 hypothetical protein JNO44_05355 [Streptomyces noursei]UJB40259.1 hypothetical protein HRD51_04770 [Streptomyces sp. A1-5]